MIVHELKRKQIVNATIDEVWDFFSSPENLDALTPSEMRFDIITPRPLDNMHEGQLIDYIVAPILGIPLKWRTEIIEVVPKVKFIDLQIKGPYKLWHHTHLFKDLGDKVEMTDIVKYALPMGPLGNLAHPVFVKSKLESIFDFRYKKVEELFNEQLAIAV